MDKKPIPFRRTVIVSFVASMVFIMVFFAVTLQFVKQEERAREMGNTLDSVEAIIDNQLQADRALMELEADEIFDEPSIRDAFLRRDRRNLAPHPNPRCPLSA